MPEPNISTCPDVGICCKFLSVGGDFFYCQQVVELLRACPLVVFVAGVRSRCPCSGVWALRVLRIYIHVCLVMINMMWTVETRDTGFNNTIHLVEQ